MQILNFIPAPLGAGAPDVVAKFDVAITEGVRIFGMTLRRNAAGDLRVRSPNVGGVHLATFTPDVAAEITSRAVAELQKGQTPNATKISA